MGWLDSLLWSVPVCTLAFGTDSRVFSTARNPLMTAPKASITFYRNFDLGTRASDLRLSGLPFKVLPIKVTLITYAGIILELKKR